MLDLVLTNEEGMISNLQHFCPIGKSHHNVLSFDFITYKNVTTEQISTNYMYHKGDYTSMKTYFNAINWEEKLKDLNVNDAWSFFHKTLLNSITKNVPISKSSIKHDTIWLNKSAMARIKKKNKSYQRFLLTKEGSDYLQYTRARNQAKWECRKAKKMFEKTLAHEVKSNPKAFFKYAKSKLKTSTGIPDLINENGKISSEDKEKATKLVNFSHPF